ncbi:hypothetical protein ACN20G_07645 [Streptomyces sp. BI20]|uniref:hypothetical protein n=1 Tax=Streptomyces sp. BI20 TaxID=3403460 RepID=UPI003C788793
MNAKHPADADAEGPKTETQLTTRIRINIPGSRPIPPVVVRKPVKGKNGSDADTGDSGAPAAPPAAGSPAAMPGPRSPEPRPAGPAPTPQAPGPGGDQGGQNWFAPRRGSDPEPAPQPPAPQHQQPQQPYGAAPQPPQSPYGAPDPQQGFGAPQGFGEAPAPYGAPPAPYGAPDPQAAPYGAPDPQQGFGAPEQGSAPNGSYPTGPTTGPAFGTMPVTPPEPEPAASWPGPQTPAAETTAPFPAVTPQAPLPGTHQPPQPQGPGPAGPGAGAPFPGRGRAQGPRDPFPAPGGNAPGAGAPFPGPGAHPGNDPFPRPGNGPAGGAPFGTNPPGGPTGTPAGGTPGVPQPPVMPRAAVPVPPPPPSAQAPAAAKAGKPKKKGRSKLVLAGGGVFALVGVAYGAGLLLNHSDVPKGTTVYGSDIEGSRDEALAKLQKAFGERAVQPLTLTVGGKNVPLAPEKAGLTLDQQETVRGAAGSDYNPLTVIGTLLGQERPAAAQVRVDEEKLQVALQAAAGGAAGNSEGTITFDTGVPVAKPGKAGSAVDTTAAVAKVKEAYETLLATGKAPAVILPVTTKEPTIGQAEIDRAMEEFAKPAMSGNVKVTIGGRSILFGPARSLREILSMQAVDGKLVEKYDLEAIKRFYGATFDGVLITRGSGEKTAVTPQDIAGVLGKALRGKTPEERAVTVPTNVA